MRANGDERVAWVGWCNHSRVAAAIADDGFLGCIPYNSDHANTPYSPIQFNPVHFGEGGV